jgi:hypothetical protein
MARRVFFSFHYGRDIWRANVVRNSWLLHPDRESAGFWDASLWEETKCVGRGAVTRLIDTALYNTSVTVVLIGGETAQRDYVRYEIQESYYRNNGLLGVYVNKIPVGRGRVVDRKGTNPFRSLYDADAGVYLSDMFPTYDWYRDGGYQNFGDWVEEAARQSGRG